MRSFFSGVTDIIAQLSTHTHAHTHTQRQTHTNTLTHTQTHTVIDAKEKLIFHGDPYLSQGNVIFYKK